MQLELDHLNLRIFVSETGSYTWKEYLIRHEYLVIYRVGQPSHLTFRHRRTDLRHSASKKGFEVMLSQLSHSLWIHILRVDLVPNVGSSTCGNLLHKYMHWNAHLNSILPH